MIRNHRLRESFARLGQSFACSLECSTSSPTFPAAIEASSLLLGAFSPNSSYSPSSRVQQKCGFATLLTQAVVHPVLEYKVKIFTGEYRGAGTQCDASIELVGKDGSSEVLTVTEGFDRGSVREFVLHAGNSIGALQHVVLRMKDAGITEFGQGWYVDRVEVEDTKGKSWLFPCNCWFGNNEPGEENGTFERNLLVSPITDNADFRTKPFTRPVDLKISAVSFPHPDKVAQGMRALSRKRFGQGGEDAYFYTESADGKVAAMGVADGVYMWRVHGIDAGAYSRSLMHGAKDEVERNTRDALDVLRYAAKHARKEKVQGSSTACIVLLDKETGILHSATLGDSGFLVAGRMPSRSKTNELMVKYRSPQQEHSFGFPYQLGHVETLDRPVDALLAQVPLEEGDIVVLGSDGLFDNIFDEHLCAEIDTMLSKGRAQGSSPAALAPAIAHRLATVAFENSLNKTVSTPYSVGASEYFDMIYHGGKKDDLTVLVGLVGPKDETPTRQ